ncbi:Uncharacterized protein YP598_3808 [Yersinia pseudotuberculosis]|uniref:Uncharacterized protein n=1 Tax=Yersinia pseudotuberculosis serotype O:1b (strain IP 31758) TaxID=349747 RepID=A0A0U1QX85_YERP3|nr:hypothetical protein YpsIP31758_3725 [Yersinia pseudotuberculosis IP 31758]UFA63422.1 Uncharacterized protein YP598_3808 [Yersinia pseudotuberculosis]
MPPSHLGQGQQRHKKRLVGYLMKRQITAQLYSEGLRGNYHSMK